MAAAHRQRADLVLRLAVQHDIIHQHQYRPRAPRLLLLQKLVDEGAVPLAKEEAGVPVALHQGGEDRVTIRAPYECHYQIKPLGIAPQKVSCCCRLPLPATPDQR